MTAMSTRKSNLRKILEAKTTNGDTKTGNDCRSPLQNVTRQKQKKQKKQCRKTLNTSEALATSLSLSLSLFSPTVCFVSFIKLKRKLKFRNKKKKFLQLATNLENSAAPKLGKRQAPLTT
jgi:hypothetical protein